MNWGKTFAAAIVALTVALPATTPAHAATDEPGAFSARPSPKAPQDKLGTFFRLHVEQGTDRRQSIVIQNHSKQSKHLLLNAVDGRTGPTSGSVYANRDEKQTEAGSWIKIPVTSVDLRPGESKRVPFALAIPAAARTGDHLAGIAVQDAHRTRSESRLSITQIIRVVVGVQIIVAGPREKSLTIGKVGLKALPATKVPSVVVNVANTGTKLCKPRLEVNLSGPDTKQQLVSRKLDTVLARDAIDYALPWPNSLQAGTYDVRVQVKECGPPQATHVTAELGKTLLGTPDQPEPSSPTVIVQRASVPWLGIAGMLGLAVALTAIVMAWFMRRRQKKA